MYKDWKSVRKHLKEKGFFKTTAIIRLVRCWPKKKNTNQAKYKGVCYNKVGDILTAFPHFTISAHVLRSEVPNRILVIEDLNYIDEFSFNNLSQ